MAAGPNWGSCITSPTAKFRRPSPRRGKPSAPKDYVPNRVPEPCHQERAEARPVHNANRLGDDGMAFVMTL